MKSAHKTKAVVFAIGAHPDDIEFQMAGTLLLLGRAGWELHYLNLSTGSCGSMTMNAATTRRTRRREAQNAAQLLQAHWHPPLCDDLEIVYELKTLRRLAAIIREVRPQIIFTHPPADYMEDHTATCRLVVTAAFARGMPNFMTTPRRRPIETDVRIYHCQPHESRDPFGCFVDPELLVDVSGVLDTQRAALLAHRSQKDWLDVTQGMGSYGATMESWKRKLGRLSKRFRFAEGWRRHSSAGFCAESHDPLRSALGPLCRPNPAYARAVPQNSSSRKRL